MVSMIARRRASAIAAVATFLALLPPLAIAQSTSSGEVIAVIAIDSYGDLKQQLDWLGPHMGQARLAGILESGLLFATQGKGLTGLDVNRPIGVVLTSSDGDLAIHAIVPVTDLDKLLAEFPGVTGPVETDGDFRRFTLPSGHDIEIDQRDGWALIGEPGKAFGITEPAKLLDPLVKDATLVIETHPSAMPESLLTKLVVDIQVRLLVRLAQRATGGDPTYKGPPLSTQALVAALDNVSAVETLSLALAADPEDDTLFLENKVILVNGPRTFTATTPLTVPIAAPRDGGQPAIKASQRLTEAATPRDPQ